VGVRRVVGDRLSVVGDRSPVILDIIASRYLGADYYQPTTDNQSPTTNHLPPTTFYAFFN
jgi:hypothetical protein